MACILHGSMKKRVAPVGPGGKKPTMADFYDFATPPFLLGPGTGQPRGGLGPGSMFNTLDAGDDCNGLDPLERRLYHPYAMPEARQERAIQIAKRKAARAKAEAAGVPFDASASAPTLGAAAATNGNSAPAAGRSASVASAPAKTVRKNGEKTPKASRSEFAPFDTEDAVSEASDWKKHYQSLAPPGLYSKGLLVNDLTYAHQNTPGVCVLRKMALPAVQPVEQSPQQVRVDHVNRQLRDVQAHDTKCRAQFARPASPGGSSQGMSGEVLPRSQHKTIGRASICRPLPADVTTTDQRGRYSLAPDSLTTSENRSNFWWKGTTQERMKEIKQFVRPLDSWVHFRDDCAQMQKSGVMRFPINTY